MNYKLYIDGKWVGSKSKQLFPSINPATEEVLGYFQQGNEDDVKAAISAAARAYEKWSKVPAPKRGELLFKVARLLERDKEKLARIMTMEMGKVLNESRGDVQEAIDMAYLIGGEGRRLFGHTTKSELPDKFAMTMRMPIGIVGCITPWNFPIAIPSWKILPAILCGNCVIFKPSSDTPLLAVEFLNIFIEAGLPNGVLNLITGKGESAGAEIVKNKSVRAISFTGHKDTGKWILSNAGVKKVGLELGSKNAIMIMDDADLKLAVDGVLWAGFGTTGQRCTAASRVIVHKKIKKQFEKMLVAKTKELRLGNGLGKNVDVGPLINKAALEKVSKYVEIGKKEGAKLLLGGKQVKINGKGFFYAPTIFTDCSNDMTICREEIFGPVVSIIAANDFDDAISKVNNTDYGLSSSIYTGSMKNAFRAIERIEAGITYVNSPTIGAEVHLPFGGVKSSGTAREGGIEGVYEFSETKTVYIDYSGRLQKAQDIE